MRKILGLLILSVAITSCATTQTQATDTQIPPTLEPPQATSTPPPTATMPEPTVAPTETLTPSSTPTLTPTLPPLGEEGNPIVWAIVPETDLNVFIPAADQAADIIMERTGLIIETQVSENFSQIVDMLCSGEAQIGALNAFSYLLAQERDCISNIVLTAEMFGGSAYQGQILVRSDSGITSIADLAGTTFCRRAEDSRSTWIVPRLMMLAAGIDPDNDLKEIIDTGTINKTIAGIYRGTCDAGATYIDARIDNREEFPDIFNVAHVLAQTIQIPYNSVTFSSILPTEIQEEIEGVFYYLEVFDGGQVLNDLYGWSGIYERGDYLYDPLREVINASGVDLESLVQE